MKKGETMATGDDIHKLKLVLKELNECLVWLNLLQEGQMLPDKSLNKVREECTVLCRIIAASIKTVKARCSAEIKKPDGCGVEVVRNWLGHLKIENPKLKIGNSLSILDFQSSILNLRAPTRSTRAAFGVTRSRQGWNPLIKKVERSRHCGSASTASATAVESGADNERERHFISITSSLSFPLRLARHS